MQCRDFREIADSYLSDELLVETNHDVLRHLETCADCRNELTARRELRSKLHEAFQHAPNLQPTDEFGVRLKEQLQDAALSRSRITAARAAYLAIAASLVIAAALGLRAVYQRWNSHRDATVVAALTQSASGDHRDCALNHRLAEAPIDLDEAGRKYDRAYIDLVKAVISEGKLPTGVQLVGAHSCIFQGRRFGHVILRYQGELVSVLVTETQTQYSSPETTEPVTTEQFDGYELAYFNTERHAVYVVSGLSEPENLSIARAIAPSVSKHIRDAERVA
jgi:anti-sigma factor RsiW